MKATESMKRTAIAHREGTNRKTARRAAAWSVSYAVALMAVMLFCVACTGGDGMNADDTNVGTSGHHSGGTSAVTTPIQIPDNGNNGNGNHNGNPTDSDIPMNPDAGTVNPNGDAGTPPAGTEGRGIRSRYLP